MGEVLIKYYNYIKSGHGMNGQIKLATATKVPSTKAAIVPDTPENIELFKKVVKEITGKNAPDF